MPKTFLQTVRFKIFLGILSFIILLITFFSVSIHIYLNSNTTIKKENIKDGINVFVLPRKLDYTKRILNLNIQFIKDDEKEEVVGDLVDEEEDTKIDSIKQIKSNKIHYTIMGKQGYFDNKNHFINIEAELVTGSPKGYPFDEYALPIFAYFEQENNTARSILNYQINYDFNSIPSISMNLQTIDDINLLIIKRSKTTIILSLLVMICMWGVSIFFSFYIVNQIKNKQPVIPVAIAIGNTILFAFPKLRSTLPDIPPIGIYLDYFSFLWNMIIVSIIVILQMVVFIKQK